MASMIFIILLAVLAIVAPMVSPYSHATLDYAAMNQSPSAEHWFGTDNLGRDMWARVWMGARVSLFIAFVAALVQSTVGIIIGGISGFFGGKVDMFLMRLSDIVDSIPLLVYVILIMMLMGSGMAPIIIAFALTGWIRMARLVRGQALSLKESDYVMAAKGLGGSNMRIIISHMVPNMLGVIIYPHHEHTYRHIHGSLPQLHRYRITAAADQLGTVGQRRAAVITLIRTS
ncbi:MAG: ABC transporter permease [Anaerovoracaceae bacterium]